MAKNQEIGVDITFRSTEIQPPLFVAGTFSHPSWTPHAMACAESDAGRTFTKKIFAQPGTTIQYKFRVGDGEWILDESRPTVTDDMGNRNNVLRVDNSVMTKSPLTPPRSPLVLQQDLGEDFLSVQAGPSFAYEFPAEGNVDHDEAPLFPYELAGRKSGSSSESVFLPEPFSATSQKESLDFDDPTLERFPSSSREEILQCVRSIETGLNADKTLFEGTPQSPIIGSGRKASGSWSASDLSDDGNLCVPPQTMAPKPSPRPSVKKRSEGSVSKDSNSMLHCIMEESVADGPCQAEVDEIVGESADKSASKSAFKSSGKSAGKSAARSTGKSADKSAGKSAGKTAGKTAGKSVESSAGTSAAKRSDKSADKSADKNATGPVGKKAAGLAEKNTTGPKGLKATGPAGKKATNPTGKKATGPAEKKATGPAGTRGTGPVGKKVTGQVGKKAAGPVSKTTVDRADDASAASEPEASYASTASEAGVDGTVPDEGVSVRNQQRSGTPVNGPNQSVGIETSNGN